MNERFTISQHWAKDGSLNTYISHRVWDGITIVFDDKFLLNSPTPGHEAQFRDKMETVTHEWLHAGFVGRFYDSIPPYWLFERELDSLDNRLSYDEVERLTA